MSRIYEALKQSEEAKPRLILKSIDEDQLPAKTARTEPREAVPALNESDLYRTEGTLSELVAEVAAPDVVPAGQGYRRVRLEVAAGAAILPFDGSDPRVSEQYRILRTNILQHPGPLRVLAISGASPGDGKTITAINLAGIIAMKSDIRVLIVDADLRRCTVSAAMGIEQVPGLTDVLSGHCKLEDAIVQVDQLPNLYVLPAGRPSLNPTELLDSASFSSLATALRADFSFVVLDTPPTTVVADFKLVQQICDGVLLVVRPDHTNRSALRKVLEFDFQKKLLGTVINGMEDWFLCKSNDSYGYYSDAKTAPYAASRSGRRK